MRGVGSGDDDEGVDDEIIASTENMLSSLVERMLKCEPEDFELVQLSFIHFCFIILFLLP